MTDEVKMQQDGHQVWPGTGDAFFSISKGNEVPVNVDLTFNNTTRITLFDQEDFGTDDNMGSVTFSEGEAEPQGSPARTKNIFGDGSNYLLFYKVRRFDF